MFSETWNTRRKTKSSAHDLKSRRRMTLLTRINVLFVEPSWGLYVHPELTLSVVLILTSLVHFNNCSVRGDTRVTSIHVTSCLCHIRCSVHSSTCIARRQGSPVSMTESTTGAAIRKLPRNRQGKWPTLSNLGALAFFEAELV